MKAQGNDNPLSLGDINAKKRKNMRNIFTAAAIIANFLVTSPALSQTNTTPSSEQKARTELKSVTDTISYDEIIKYPIDWLVRHYGKEKTLEITQNCILREFNKIRQEHSLPPLSLEKHLVVAAQNYTEEMQMNKRYGHTAKNWDRPTDRAKKSWYPWGYVRENLWRNYYSIEQGIASWKGSSIHFETIIDPKLVYLWVGYEDIYWDALFGGK